MEKELAAIHLDLLDPSRFPSLPLYEKGNISPSWIGGKLQGISAVSLLFSDLILIAENAERGHQNHNTPLYHIHGLQGPWAHEKGLGVVGYIKHQYGTAFSSAFLRKISFPLHSIVDRYSKDLSQ